MQNTSSISKIIFLLNGPFTFTSKIVLFYISLKVKLLSRFKPDSNKSLFTIGFENDEKIKMRLQDIGVFYDIFHTKTYEINPSTNLKNIVDLGGHIGLAAQYFSMIYHPKTLISVEPADDNFELLKQNSNYTTLNKAISINDNSLNLALNEKSFNHSIDLNGDLTVSGICMDTLLKTYSITQIDLLKIDIEGYEKVLLSHNTKWLKRVRRIVIEIHDPYTKEKLMQHLLPFWIFIKYYKTF